jgi:putative membrane protein|tara:strand:- start:302 stop:736 length:435 start_codon:yes stop_codon:yes gene_type:complete
MNSYLLFKSLHLIAAISWMVGLLYLPRIFVYHVENLNDQNTCLVFKVMERKLFFYIMTPAMIVTWLFGLILIYILGFDILFTLWIKLKLLFVILLTFYHFYLARCLNDFKLEQNRKTSKFFRIMNEVPTILLVLIVFVVIFKPI